MFQAATVSGGSSAPRMSASFIKGIATRVRNGWYSTASNFEMFDVTYDGDSTFTLVCYKNSSEITSYTNVYYR